MTLYNLSASSIIYKSLDLLRSLYVKTKITDFHQDEYKDWVADLSCGHSRHFRHNPPFQVCEWVKSPQGRDTYIGFELACKICESSDV